jgi:hypothetical protein
VSEVVRKHVHTWVETEVGCEDCGSHEALICDGEGECPVVEEHGDMGTIDLVMNDDPRGEVGEST